MTFSQAHMYSTDHKQLNACLRATREGAASDIDAEGKYKLSLVQGACVQVACS